MPRRVAIRASGHPHLRATHHTLEVTRDEAVTSRATCVVGVGASAFPPELHLLRGPVRITVAAGPGGRQTGQAVINPDHQVDRRVVVRRSDWSDPDTLAIRSEITAVDLDPALRTALGRPDTPVLVTVEEIAPPPPLVLVHHPAAGPLPGRADRLWRYADATASLAGVSPGPGRTGRRAALPPVTADGVVAATLSGPLDQAPARAVRWLVTAVRQGARLLAPGADATTVALLAAGLPPAPAVRLGTVDRRALRQPAILGLLRYGPLPTVLALAPADAEPVLGPLAAGDSGGRPLAVPVDLIDAGVQLRWTTVAEALPELAGSGASSVTVVLGSREPADTPVVLAEVAQALQAAGVSPRLVAEALRGWGVGRSEVYRWLAAGGGDRPDRSGGG